MTHRRAQGNQGGARAALSPAAPLESPEHRTHAAHKLYVKSHQAWDAGEPVSRDYCWPAGLDPATHAFGAPAMQPRPAVQRATAVPGSADCVPLAAGKATLGRPAAQESPELAEGLRQADPQPPATQAARRQQALNLRSHDRLGQPRQLPCADRWVLVRCQAWPSSLLELHSLRARPGGCQLPRLEPCWQCRTLPPDHTFGGRAGAGSEATELQAAGLGAAGALQHTMYGGGAAGAQAGDATTGLGKSLHEGWRNTDVPGRVSAWCRAGLHGCC